MEVEARSDSGEMVTAWTDGRGRYEIQSLAPGDWTVTARLWDDQRQARTRVAIRRPRGAPSRRPRNLPPLF